MKSAINMAAVAVVSGMVGYVIKPWVGFIMVTINAIAWAYVASLWRDTSEAWRELWFKR